MPEPNRKLEVPRAPESWPRDRAAVQAYCAEVVQYAKERLGEGAPQGEVVEDLLLAGHPHQIKFLVSQARQQVDYDRLGVTPGDLRMLSWLGMLSGVAAVLGGLWLMPANWSFTARIAIVVAAAIALSSALRAVAFRYFAYRRGRLGGL